MFKPNVGFRDGALRVWAAVLLTVSMLTPIAPAATHKWILLVVGLLLVSAISGKCLVYSLLGIDTRARERAVNF